MTIHTKYHSEVDMLSIHLSGIVTVEEVELLYEEMTSSKDYLPTVRSLWDFRTADFAFVTNDFIKQIFAIRKRYPERGNAKAAFVVEGDLAFGVSRMYETLSSFELPQHIQVFRDITEAEVWLFQ